MTTADAATDTPGSTEAPEAVVRVEDGARTAIGVSRGATHTGHGDLNQSFFYGVSQERRRRGPSSFDEHNEGRLTRLFVRPRGYEQAREVLRTSRVVLLHGSPGCGRKYTALHLLSEQRTDDGGPIRILDGRDDPAARELLAEHVTEAACLLLDLSDVDDHADLRHLADLLNEVRTRNAYVAVVLRRPPDSSVPDVLRREASGISRPAGPDVFLRHLELEGVPGDDPSGWRDEVHAYVAGSSMTDIRELALLTRDAREAEPNGGFDAWVAGALARVTSRAVETARALDIPHEGRCRTLAFAAAVFAGCPPDVVVEAERRLVQAVGLPDGDDHELVSPDLDSRLGRIRARLDGDLVDFDNVRHASAVRTYFWTQFPGLREGFDDWLVDGSDLAQECGLPVAEYVGRYTDLAFRTGQPGLVGAAVERWALRGRDLAFAGVALIQGIHDVRYSAWFRARCYRWAISRTLASDLARVLVLVCTTAVAPSWPDQAVVRLHHLTGHSDPVVRTDARDGLVTVLDDAFALRSFLSRLVNRPDDPGGQRLFLTVVDPVRLRSVQHPPTADLTTCWATAFAGLPWAECERGVRRWLTADTGDASSSWLPQVLARAAVTGGRTAAVHAATHRWLAEPVAEPDGGRRAAARRLLNELDTEHRAQISARAITNGRAR